MMMDGAMGSMMGWMMGIGLLGWVLVIALWWLSSFCCSALSGARTGTGIAGLPALAPRRDPRTLPSRLVSRGFAPQ